MLRNFRKSTWSKSISYDARSLLISATNGTPPQKIFSQKFHLFSQRKDWSFSCIVLLICIVFLSYATQIIQWVDFNSTIEYRAADWWSTSGYHTERENDVFFHFRESKIIFCGSYNCEPFVVVNPTNSMEFNYSFLIIYSIY